MLGCQVVVIVYHGVDRVLVMYLFHTETSGATIFSRVQRCLREEFGKGTEEYWGVAGTKGGFGECLRWGV